jgi:hypothetical protein
MLLEAKFFVCHSENHYVSGRVEAISAVSGFGGHSIISKFCRELSADIFVETVFK